MQSQTKRKSTQMEVKELYAQLGEFHGSIQIIANRSHFSRETVRKVLKGDSNNPNILITAVEVLDELRKEKQNQDSAAKAALESLKQ